MTRALYPGTFDPIHNGHVDIAARAAGLFDELIIGVYDSPPKTLTFDTPQRLSLARDALAHLPNVLVLEVHQADPVSLVRFPKVLLTRGAVAKFEEIMA